MADVVEESSGGSRELLRCDDAGIAAELRRKDNVLDRLHAALQRFLGELRSTASSPGDERDRLAHILIAALNLEQQGDIIDKGFLPLTAKRIRRRLRLTRPELADANAMHEHLRSLLHLAVAVFMGEDPARGAALGRGEGGSRIVSRPERPASARAGCSTSIILG